MVILFPRHGNFITRAWNYFLRHYVFFSARNSVYIYGNIEPNGIKELSFIVNVVPDPDYTRDYEQLYRATQQGGVGDIVDGETRDKGYFIKGYYPEEFINTPAQRCAMK